MLCCAYCYVLVLEITARFTYPPLASPSPFASNDPRITAAEGRVRASVTLAVERAEEVASLFEGAAAALAVDLPSLLAQLVHLSTPLEAYHRCF